MIKPSQCLHSRKQWARPPNQNRLRLRNHTHIEFTLVNIREIAVFFNLRFYWLSIICNNGNGIIRRMRILYWISTIFICDRTSLLSFVCSAQLPQSRNRKRIWAITMLVWMLAFTTVVVMPQRNYTPNTNTCSTTPIGVHSTW